MIIANINWWILHMLMIIANTQYETKLKSLGNIMIVKNIFGTIYFILKN